MFLRYNLEKKITYYLLPITYYLEVMRTRTQIQQTLLKRDAIEDNPWSVWIGANRDTATQLLNLDGSNPYVREISVTNEMLAYDNELKISSEVYRVTWVTDTEPLANASYWLSYDGGATKDKVSLSYYRSRTKRSHWFIFLKNG